MAFVSPCVGKGRQLSVPRADEYDQKSPFEDKDFDERAFLSGKIGILSDDPQERPPKGLLELTAWHKIKDSTSPRVTDSCTHAVILRSVLVLSDTDFRWKPEWLGKNKERQRKVSQKAHHLGMDEYEVIYSLEKKGTSVVLSLELNESVRSHSDLQ